MDYVLGIDLGSSSLKGIIMNNKGEIIAEQSTIYPINSPKMGYSEQNPQEWIRACEEVLTELAQLVPDFSNNLVAISFSGQMHSLVIVDEKNEPIYPAILWNDVRTTNECKKIEKLFGSEIIKITKNKIVEGFTLPKILWLQENEPQIWQKAKKIMLPKDYLSYWLTGNIYTEYSDAAGTLLFDIEKKDWSKDILNKFSIPETIVPKLVESLDQVGVVRKEIRDRYQFQKNVKVFAGGADNACAALGAGLVSEEVALVSIGTSGVLSTFEHNLIDYKGNLHFFNHVLPNMYYAMGVTLAAGNSLQWFKDTFAKNTTYTELLKNVDKISPGSDNLYFSPYIVGERTPHFDSTIRGSFIGIDTNHRLDHFTRAVLEGIVYSLKDSQLIIENEHHKNFEKFISIGGGAKNSEWLQIQADIFNVDIVQLDNEQGPGLGACMIAAMGCGWFSDIPAMLETCLSYKKKVYHPKIENVQIYQEKYKKWKKIYMNTKEIIG